LARKNGQIIARGAGRWLVRVSLGRDRETGRRRYLNQTIRGGFRAAQRYLNLRLEERCGGGGLEGERLTLNQYLDRWLELAARPRLRTKSYRDYKALLGRTVPRSPTPQGGWRQGFALGGRQSLVLHSRYNFGTFEVERKSGVLSLSGTR